MATKKRGMASALGSRGIAGGLGLESHIEALLASSQPEIIALDKERVEGLLSMARISQEANSSRVSAGALMAGSIRPSLESRHAALSSKRKAKARQ